MEVKRRRFLIILSSALFILLGLTGLFIYEYFRIKPNDVHFTNVTSSSVTVSWNTDKAVGGSVKVKESGSFLPFALFNRGSRFFDTRDVKNAEVLGVEATAENVAEGDDFVISSSDFETDVEVTDMGEYYTHHVTVTGLDPQTEYSFMVGDTLLFRDVKDFEGNESITTLEVPESVKSPYPAYGSVKDAQNREDISADELVPVTDAIVYFNYLDESMGKRSNTLSSSMNSNGNWYIDASGAVDEDGNDFKEYHDSVEGDLYVELVFDVGELGVWKKRVKANMISPVSETVLNMPGLIQEENVLDSVIQVIDTSAEVKGVLLAQFSDAQEICELNGLGTWTGGACKCVSYASFNTSIGVCSCFKDYTQSGNSCIPIDDDDEAPCSCACPNGYSTTKPSGDFDEKPGTCNYSTCEKPKCYKPVTTGCVATSCSCNPPCPPISAKDTDCSGDCANYSDYYLTLSSCQSADCDSENFIYSKCKKKDNCGYDCTYNGEEYSSVKCYKPTSTSPDPEVDGDCGTNRGDYNAGSTNWRGGDNAFCSAGTPKDTPEKFLTIDEPYASWTCLGLNDGDDRTCEAILLPAENTETGQFESPDYCTQFTAPTCESACYYIDYYDVQGDPHYVECADNICKQNAEDIYKLTCDSTVGQETEFCPGGGKPGVSCTYVPSENKCKQCGLISDGKGGYDPGWVALEDDSFCNDQYGYLDISQSVRNCNTGSEDSTAQMCVDSHGDWNYSSNKCDCSEDLGLVNETTYTCTCESEKETWNISRGLCEVIISKGVACMGCGNQYSQCVYNANLECKGVGESCTLVSTSTETQGEIDEQGDCVSISSNEPEDETDPCYGKQSGDRCAPPPPNEHYYRANGELVCQPYSEYSGTNQSPKCVIVGDLCDNNDDQTREYHYDVVGACTIPGKCRQGFDPDGENCVESDIKDLTEGCTNKRKGDDCIWTDSQDDTVGSLFCHATGVDPENFIGKCETIGSVCSLNHNTKRYNIWVVEGKHLFCRSAGRCLSGYYEYDPPQDSCTRGVSTNYCWENAFNLSLYRSDGSTIMQKCYQSEWVDTLLSNIQARKCRDFIAGSSTECSRGALCQNLDTGAIYSCNDGVFGDYDESVISSDVFATEMPMIDAGTKCTGKEIEEGNNACYCIGSIDKGIGAGEWCRDVRVKNTYGNHPSSYICEDDSEEGQVCKRSGEVCKDTGHEDGLTCIFDSPDQSSNFTVKDIKGIYSNANRVFAQEDTSLNEYIIDPQTGMFSGVESGYYIFEYQGKYYSFSVINDNGEILIYIDENNNQQYDEDVDVKVSDIATEINIVPIERRYDYSLEEGLNFISLPYLINSESHRTAASLLAKLNEVYNDSIYSISRFDGGQWKMVGQNSQLYDNNDFQLLPGVGYVIKAKRDVDISIVGQPVQLETTEDSSPIYFNTGWNLIGLYGTNIKSYTAKTLLEDISSGDMTAVNVTDWVENRQMYEGFQVVDGEEYGFDYPLNTLESYFVRIKEGSGNWQPQISGNN